MNRSRITDYVSFGDVVYPPGGLFGPRVQQGFQLVVIKSGHVTVQVDDREHRLEQQQAILLLPGRTEYFRFAVDRHSRHTWLAAHPGLLPTDVQEQLQYLDCPFSLTTRIESLMEFGLEFPLSSLQSAYNVLNYTAISLFYCLAFEHNWSRSLSQSEKIVQRARTYMESHIGEPITLSDISNAVHLTPQYFTRMFRRRMGITPMRYLWRIRTQRGAALLKETGLPIRTISERLGFGSPFHFSRSIRQLYGRSPRVLREHAWHTTSTMSKQTEI